MILGVLSDTHGQTANLRQALALLDPFAPDLLLHCGDIGSVEIIEQLAGRPTHYVFGNVDDDQRELRRAIEQAGQVCHGEFGSLELAGRRIAFMHGDDGPRLRDVIACGKWDLVCHGHTHVARWEQVGGAWVLNPGAVFRARPHSVAIVELPELQTTRLDF